MAPESALMTVSGTTPRTRSRQMRYLMRVVEGWAFISPAVLGLLIFTAGPMIASAYYSLTNYDLINPPRFVGFDNYTRLFTRDSLFTLSLYNTAYYTLLAVPAQTIVALVQAFILNMKVKGVNIYRTLFYLPSVTPSVAMIILWVYILGKNYGLLNSALWLVGIPPIDWLFDPNIVKISLVLMTLWHVGSRMVIFLAALQGVPNELYEAAELDGASYLRKQWHVTLPMISPVVFFNIIMGIIGTFQVFTAAFIATAGGPMNATLFYVLYLYRQGWESLRMGYASALAWILFFIIMIITGIQFGLSKHWVYYETVGARG
jgi:multiple sugar transport system permease protein